MDLIKEFAERIFNENGAFTISDGNAGNKRFSFFIPARVGKAVYVYGDYNFHENNNSAIDMKPQLRAIVSDGTIYVYDEFFFGIRRWEQTGNVLPDNACFFSDYLRKCNDYVKKDAFPFFYNSLGTGEVQITDEDLVFFRETARRHILSGVTPVGEPEINRLFTEQDAANFLCGFIELETETSRRLAQQKDLLIASKTRNKKIKAVMERQDTVREWERKLAEGLNSVDAKSVKVEFEYNGRTASGKMEPDEIMRILIKEKRFDYFTFINGSEGVRQLKHLGISKYGNELKPCHIAQITYGRKTLYKKDEKLQ